MIQPAPAPEFTLELSRVLNAKPEIVFAAWTDPQQVGQWLKPNAEFKHGQLEIT